ncbi:MAG: cytidine deaminase [Candidatus Saccharibacteria bacterium]
MTDQELLEMALDVQNKAYAPYSGFKVGAVLLADGLTFSGCNIENISYGLTICAERSAVAKAVSAGKTKDFEKLLVVGGDTIVYPCGACLQVLAEFQPDLEIICANNKGEMVKYSLSDLLPHGFDRAQLGG